MVAAAAAAASSAAPGGDSAEQPCWAAQISGRHASSVTSAVGTRHPTHRVLLPLILQLLSALSHWPLLCLPTHPAPTAPPPAPPALADVEAKFAKSAWGQKLAKRVAKAAMTDFDRYQAAVQKMKRSAKVGMSGRLLLTGTPLATRRRGSEGHRPLCCVRHICCVLAAGTGHKQCPHLFQHCTDPAALPRSGPQVRRAFNALKKAAK